MKHEDPHLHLLATAILLSRASHYLLKDGHEKLGKECEKESRELLKWMEDE